MNYREALIQALWESTGMIRTPDVADDVLGRLRNLGWVLHPPGLDPQTSPLEELPRIADALERIADELTNIR